MTKSIVSLLVSLWIFIPAANAQRPVQISLIPGWGTNGPLNSNAKDNFSINLIGGSAASLDGVELGGVFNSERKNAKGLQAAGVLNKVDGPVRGAQLAGVANIDQDSLHGFQAAGVVNIAKRIKGVQVSGLLNKTRHLQGVQLGIINFADTSDGVSIGLINIIHHGMHELSVYADEWSPLNMAFRSGTSKFYGILIAGMNPDHDRRSYYFGYGVGRQFTLTQNLALRPELTFLHLAPLELHNFDRNDFLTRLNLDLHWAPAKNFGLSAGPSFTLYDPQGNYYIGGRLYKPLPNGYSTFRFAKSNFTGWIGWRIAVNVL